MTPSTENQDPNLAVAQKWCLARGAGWQLTSEIGRGGTATVYEVLSPDGQRTLKIYDIEFSQGELGDIEAERVGQQVSLGEHECPYLVKTYDGGTFEGRHFLLMSRAPGQELEKRLAAVPRAAIRQIVDQVAQACIYLHSKGFCHRDIKSANIFISDDFTQATLLDLSVTRAIHDHVGIGTDHDGQLPVVATARYSPPEYLFRLLDPGPELWHALNVYQLGALLHDLIMRRPLFQDEYAKSKENRYRFAWIVATTEPSVAALDVDQDLIFTARRALDKSWQRRSTLSLRDFLSDTPSRATRALETLGLVRLRPAPSRPERAPGAALSRVAEVATALQVRIKDHLKAQGITARHEVLHGVSDRSKVVHFGALGHDGPFQDVTYFVTITLVERSDGWAFEARATLAATFGGAHRERSIDLPPTKDGDGCEEVLFEHAQNAIGVLAAALVSHNGG